MLFCPHCGNMLLIEDGGAAGDAGLRFYCQTCPYLQKVTEIISKKLPLTRKKVDDVLGGDKAWDNVDQADAVCPNCDHKRAYFMQIQIRSADEPMTTFYRCVACKSNWSAN